MIRLGLHVGSEFRARASVGIRVSIRVSFGVRAKRV